MGSTFGGAKIIISVTTRHYRKKIQIITRRMLIKEGEIIHLIKKRKENVVAFEAEAVKEETEVVLEEIVTEIEKRGVVMMLVAKHTAD